MVTKRKGSSRKAPEGHYISNYVPQASCYGNASLPPIPHGFVVVKDRSEIVRGYWMTSICGADWSGYSDKSKSHGPAKSWPCEEFIKPSKEAASEEMLEYMKIREELSIPF